MAAESMSAANTSPLPPTKKRARSTGTEKCTLTRPNVMKARGFFILSVIFNVSFLSVVFEFEIILGIKNHHILVKLKVKVRPR